MVGRRTSWVVASVALVLVLVVGGCELIGVGVLKAGFTSDLDRDSAPATLTLDAGTSTGTIANYAWDVAGVLHTGDHVVVTLEEGEYVVTLTVTDAGGEVDSASRTYTIRPAQPDLAPPVPGTLQLKAAPGQTREASVTLRNLGSLHLDVSVEVVSAASEWLAVDAEGVDLPDASQQDLLVTATCGAAQETRSGSIVLTTNDPDTPDVKVPVALVCTSVPAGSFDLQLRFEDKRFTPSQRAIIEQAAMRWEAVIVGDVDDVTGVTQSEVNQCNFGFGFTGTVDDLLILVDAEDIDGPGGVAGQGGPCWLRGGFDSIGLPYLGRVYFDSTDLDAMEADGTLFAVAMHEIGHTLGFLHYVWENHDLIAYDAETCDWADEVLFTGTDAVSRWQALGGTGMPPVADYWSGACSHWDEGAFGDELMTPYTGEEDALSTVTIASLDDLGYLVDYAAADPYALPGGESVRADAAPRQTVADGLPPVGWVAPDGTRHRFGDDGR